MERLLRAIMDIRAQLTFLQPRPRQGASQITRLQLRRVTLFPLSSFRLANLGRKPLRSGFRGDCWLVWLVWLVLCATVKYCPSDSGELVGKSYGQNIFV